MSNYRLKSPDNNDVVFFNTNKVVNVRFTQSGGNEFAQVTFDGGLLVTYGSDVYRVEDVTGIKAVLKADLVSQQA